MVIQWFGKGTPRTGITTHYPAVSPTNYFSTLTLNNVTTNDDGVYYAVLSNSFGVTSTRIVTLTFGSIVRGLVTDATLTTPTGAAVPVPGALVSIGTNSTLTDADGNYELVGVQRGDLRAGFMANKTHVRLNENVQFWNLSTATAALLTASKTNFYDYVDDQFEIGKGQTVAKRFSMSPIFSGLRFVMNWTNNPGDLDLLLRFPESVPVSYPWIDYLQQNRGSTNAWPFALRDVDVTTGWGPETISIHRFTNGTYSLYARKYTGQGGAALAQSSAQVLAYLGGDVTNGFSTQIKPHGSVAVPTSGTNDWWYVCDIDCLTTNITWINQLLATPPGGLQQQPRPAKSSEVSDPIASHPPKSRFETDVNYEWNFGDGSPLSTENEPLHAYAEPGWKTVTLRMTQRFGNPPKTDSVTKTNYLYVENVAPTVTITNHLPNTIFRAGDPFTLQSLASGMDDPIQRVEYYLLDNLQTNYLGAATNAPYSLVFSNTNCLDCTNTFVALARDLHGAATWSAPVSIVTLDLSGEILIVRNFPDPEIDTMVSHLTYPLIPSTDSIGFPIYRSPVVKVLDQSGLRLDLVRGFKVIIWSDQGNLGLTDNDVGVLHQAYSAGIPLYLIGEHLVKSRDLLTDTDRFFQWRDLVGLQSTGSNLPPPLALNGIKSQPNRDGLFDGFVREGEAGTSIPYFGTVERVGLLNADMDVVAAVPAAGSPTNSPVMLRYPRFTQPDFGQTRRLVQGFRVASGEPAPPPEEAQSLEDRRLLFVNGVAWLLRLFECSDLNVALDPVPLTIPAGSVGNEITFITRITQNGSCTAGGILVTNQLSPRLQLVRAEITPEAEWMPTDM